MKYVYCDNCHEAFPAPMLGTQKCPRCGKEAYPVYIKRGINGLLAYIMAAGIVVLAAIHYLEGGASDIILAPIGIVLAALFLYFSTKDNRYMRNLAVETALSETSNTHD